MQVAKPEAIPASKSGAEIIRLSENAAWPQLGKVPMFVRSFYKDCYEGAMKKLTPGQKYMVRGNAGSK
jgi:hypothetical protein